MDSRCESLFDDEDGVDETEADDDDDEDDDMGKTSLKRAALAAPGSTCRVVARIGTDGDRRAVRRRTWRVRAWPMPLLEGQMKIQGVEGIAMGSVRPLFL